MVDAFVKFNVKEVEECFRGDRYKRCLEKCHHFVVTNSKRRKETVCKEYDG